MIGPASPAATGGADGRSVVANPSLDCGRCAVVEEADHRIANHLALLAGSVRLKAAALTRSPAPLSPREVRLMLEGVLTQIDTISRLHRSMATGDQGAAHVQALLHTICRGFAATFPERLELVEDLSCDQLVAAKHVPALSQIVSELITNAAKHAGSDGQAGRIVVRTRVAHGSAILIEILDDGPGLPADFDPSAHDGLGLRLIRAQVRKLGATISFENIDPGLRVQMALPPTVAAAPLDGSRSMHALS